jgi:hypothetical protein
MKSATLSMAGLLSLVPASMALAGEETITIQLPPSAYAFKHFPECEGFREEIHKLMRDEKFQAAVASANAVAGAVVTAIGEVDGISAKHGGELSKVWRNAVGGSKSTCGTLTYVLPAGTEPVSISVSNRHGNDEWLLSARDAFGYPVNGTIRARVDRQDWSGWKDIGAAWIAGRYVVQATAVNWQHNGRTNQTMTVTWVDAGTRLGGIRQVAPPPAPPPPPQADTPERKEGGLFR